MWYVCLGNKKVETETSGMLASIAFLSRWSATSATRASPKLMHTCS